LTVVSSVINTSATDYLEKIIIKMTNCVSSGGGNTTHSLTPATPLVLVRANKILPLFNFADHMTTGKFS